MIRFQVKFNSHFQKLNIISIILKRVKNILVTYVYYYLLPVIYIRCYANLPYGVVCDRSTTLGTEPAPIGAQKGAPIYPVGTPTYLLRENIMLNFITKII